MTRGHRLRRSPFDWKRVSAKYNTVTKQLPAQRFEQHVLRDPGRVEGGVMVIPMTASGVWHRHAQKSPSNPIAIETSTPCVTCSRPKTMLVTAGPASAAEALLEPAQDERALQFS
jgi:hypothetical protein